MPRGSAGRTGAMDGAIQQAPHPGRQANFEQAVSGSSMGEQPTGKITVAQWHGGKKPRIAQERPSTCFSVLAARRHKDKGQAVCNVNMHCIDFVGEGSTRSVLYVIEKENRAASNGAMIY